MNHKQAFAAAKRILGQRAAIRHEPDAPDAKQQAAMREQLPALREAKTSAEAARVARLTELLNDPEYQRLAVAAKDAGKAVSACLGQLSHHRCTVGTTSTMFFTVEAQGDTWEETLAELARKKGVKLKGETA